MVDTCAAFELLTLQQLRQLPTELVHHRQVQGTEVLVEGQVAEFLKKINVSILDQ